MKLHELKSVANLPENELIIADSVRALMGITLFWSPNMERMYSQYNSPKEDDSLEVIKRITQKKEKAKRGLIWRQAHLLLNNLGQPATKEKLTQAYKSLDKKE